MPICHAYVAAAIAVSLNWMILTYTSSVGYAKTTNLSQNDCLVTLVRALLDGKVSDF